MALDARRRVALLACFAAALTVAFPDAPGVWLLPTLVGLIATGGIVIGIITYRPKRSIREHIDEPEPWTVLAASVLLSVAGGFLAQRQHVAGSLGTSLGLGLQLMGASVAVLGMALILRDRSSRELKERLSEAGIAALALGFVAWVWLVEPLLQLRATTLGASLATMLITIPNLILVVLGIQILASFSGQPKSYWWLLLALVCRLGADLVLQMGLLQGTPVEPLINALTTIQWALWAVAALHPSMSRYDEPVQLAPRRLASRRMSFAAVMVLTGPCLTASMALVTHPLPLEVLGIGTGAISVLVVGHLTLLIQGRADSEHRAQHDDLTGLPNRPLFIERVAAAMAVARRTGGLVTVMYLDLDHFKTVNDSLGHVAGNQLLQQVALRLVKSVSQGDTVARLGGDEFAVLLPYTLAPEQGIAVAERLLKDFDNSFIIGKDEEVFSTLSIGLASSGADGGTTADAMITNADTALYQAKAMGRNTYQVFARDMNERAQKRLSLQSTLHAAVEHDELLLHYQPIVELKSGRICGVEALVRWTHPRLGVLSPAEFIGLAEEIGLISAVGEWVLRTACAQTQKWAMSEAATVPVSVNLSARQFQAPEMASIVSRALRQSNLDPSLLELELTESLTMNEEDRAIEALLELKAMGVSCSIDDFGTGYSNLSKLTRFPFDRLKIDKSFVERISSDSNDNAVIIAIIAMAHSLKLGVVAEGVETQEQLDFLLQQGCDQMQGYLFSRPLPPEQMQELLMLEKESPGQARLLLLHGQPKEETSYIIT